MEREADLSIAVKHKWLSFASLPGSHSLAQPAARFMRLTFCWLILMAMVAAGCAPTARRTDGHSGTPQAKLPGKQPDGSVLLPNQWSLRPAGQQVELGDFPI